MIKKKYQINGISISYCEKNEAKPNILFFIHGNSCAADMWSSQYESPIFNDYHILSVDLPGHGDSDAYLDYGPIEMAKLLATVIKELTVGKQYILIGFSYGANLIAEIAALGLQPAGMVFSGATIVGKDYDPLKILLNIPSNIFLREEISIEDAALFFNQQIPVLNEAVKVNLLTNFLKTKKGVRESIISCAANGIYTDEFNTLKSQDIPLLFIFGKQDALVDINYLDSSFLQLWQNKIFKLENAGHFVQNEQPEQFNHLLLLYAREILK